MKTLTLKQSNSRAQNISVATLFFFVIGTILYPFAPLNSQTDSDADYYIVAEYISSTSQAMVGEADATNEEVAPGSVPVAELEPQSYKNALIVLFLLCIIVLLTLYILYISSVARRREQRLLQETKEITEQVGKIFSALRDEIHDQIAHMYKRKNLTAKEKKVIAELTDALEVSEILIDKEINDCRTVD